MGGFGISLSHPESTLFTRQKAMQGKRFDTPNHFPNTNPVGFGFHVVLWRGQLRPPLRINGSQHRSVQTSAGGENLPLRRLLRAIMVLNTIQLDGFYVSQFSSSTCLGRTSPCLISVESVGTLCAIPDAHRTLNVSQVNAVSVGGLFSSLYPHVDIFLSFFWHAS